IMIAEQLSDIGVGAREDAHDAERVGEARADAARILGIEQGEKAGLAQQFDLGEGRRVAALAFDRAFSQGSGDLAGDGEPIHAGGRRRVNGTRAVGLFGVFMHRVSSVREAPVTIEKEYRAHGEKPHDKNWIELREDFSSIPLCYTCNLGSRRAY